jgi:hypothetical protein
MSESCLVLLQNDPLKPSSMASPRAKVALNGQENGRRPRGIPQLSPRTGMRGHLSPARESRVATHTTTVSEGSDARTEETNQEESSPCSPNDFSVPDVAASFEIKDETITPDGSASSSCTALGPTVPQHEIDDSSPAESQYQAILQRNKGILLQGLSLTSAVGNLTLVSDGIVICPLCRRLSTSRRTCCCADTHFLPDRSPCYLRSICLVEASEPMTPS